MLFQALALQRKWRVPEYIILTECGPPHRKEFTIICRLESLTEQGVLFLLLFISIPILLVFFFHLFDGILLRLSFTLQELETPKKQQKRKQQRKWWRSFRVYRDPLRSHGSAIVFYIIYFDFLPYVFVKIEINLNFFLDFIFLDP